MAVPLDRPRLRKGEFSIKLSITKIFQNPFSALRTNLISNVHLFLNISLFLDVTPISLPSRSSFQKIPPKRISPERKRQRLECEILQSAIATSIASEEIYWKERTFSNIADVTNFLTKHPLSDWTASFKPEAIFLFFILEDANSSELKCGLKISNELKLINRKLLNH